MKMDFIFFLLGNFLESEFYVPTFRNTLPVPSSWVLQELVYNTDKDNIQTSGNHPKEKIQHSELGESLKVGRWICP
jgi:hypothetical protein